jgi:hypothetical protein
MNIFAPWQEGAARKISPRRNFDEFDEIDEGDLR